MIQIAQGLRSNTLLFEVWSLGGGRISWSYIQENMQDFLHEVIAPYIYFDLVPRWMERLRRDGCVPVGHPTNSVMESGECHGICNTHSSVNAPEESPTWKERCPR